MRGMLVARLGHAIGCSLIGGAICGWTERATASEEPAAVTNVLQLRQSGSQNPSNSYFIRLDGNVWWANPAQGRLVLQDASGAVPLELNLQDRPVRAGQRVRLEGNATIARSGAGFKVGVKGPVVDNDGVHSIVEKSGSVYLTAGEHPIRVEWFNGVERYGLEVDYEGPGLARQRIPDTALFRTVTNANGSTTLVPGLDFKCYEGAEEILPAFNRLTPVKTGLSTNFDLSVTSRSDHVGLQFNGSLRVPSDGLYTFYTRSDDGSRLFIEGSSLKLEITGPGVFPTTRRMAIGQALNEAEDCVWAEVEGTVTFVSEQDGGLKLELLSGTGRMPAEIADASDLAASQLLNRRIQVRGVCQGTFNADGQKAAGVLFVSGANDLKLIETPFDRETAKSANSKELLPVLTAAVEVHRLKREEAQRQYPVKLRGVITCVLPDHQAFVIQDSTRGLYVVDFSASRSGPPQIGEFLDVEGTTDPSLFAPIVNARRVASQGRAHLPDPVRPNWDQLVNGSLDAQYVEIQGVPTNVRSNTMTLLTREGRINLELRVNGTPPVALENYEDALVRIRGCLFANWDYITHEVKPGELRVYGADLGVDQPAPADLFSVPAKTAAELRLFDPQAGVFQRVKVSGQIVHVRDGEYFMMQGSHGVRFLPKKAAELTTGDHVEVVGFPELLGSTAPVLREAVTRKTGHGELPAPRQLLSDDFLRADYDGTRVRLPGKLVNVRKTRSDQVLELQNGVRSYVARLNPPAESLQSLPIGSRLELTGVYTVPSGNRMVGQDVASFDLLLDSPSDIKVLARPPWWTLERLLVMVGALASVLVITVLWITQLHRKVEERTVALETQIRERQRVEHQHEMEQERARIAQDLHDELGSDVTEIGMLAARAKSMTTPNETRGRYLEQMGSKSRDMVAALDEIVWAMNPKNDSFSSLVSYFSLYADRFLGLANISWRLEGPSAPMDHVVNSRHRHQLFLAFREALTNVVRHSGATEVRLNFELREQLVRLTIADNGRGLPPGGPTEEMDGVANMRRRIEKLGGQFEINSEPGRGTVLRFCMPPH